MEDTHVSLAHGNGGRFMRELIADIFAKHLANPELDVDSDAAHVTLDDGEVFYTTDGFIVQPLEFPGGSIGSLAVHGTCNDLAVSGAEPRYLTLSALIEEGLEIATLDRIVADAAAAARAAGVRVVAGDTKVLPRGQGGGLYLTASGLGVRRGPALSLAAIREGDAILVSGPVGDHGIAVLLAREQFGLQGNLRSDSACVWPLARALLAVPGLRFMRDPTRGGLATVAHELARATRLGVGLEETAIPIRDAVKSVCEMLGYDPLYLACEGRIVAVVDSRHAAAALTVWRALPQGQSAAIVGKFAAQPQRVVLTTSLGGERVLEELEDDPLPRIC
jgi:hydrogenase expression/formation protein HypE